MIAIIRHIGIWIIVLGLGMASTSAQRIPNPQKNNNSGTLQRDSLLEAPEANHDPLEIRVYNAHSPEIHSAYQDTMLGFFFQQIDPIRQQEVDYVHLGSLGTPSRPLLFDLGNRQGVQLGFRQFDLYRRKFEDIRYFRINRTFTETYYAQPHSQSDFIFKGAFSRNLSPQWNIAIDYDRISHDGIYTHQKSRHTAFTINASFKNKKENYHSYTSYSYNDIQQQDNGGIVSEEDFRNPLYDIRSNIPVLSERAFTRSQEQILGYTQYYHLNKKEKDSIASSSNRQIRLGHQFEYSPGNYKFYDNRPDSVIYNDLLTDTRGVRQYLDWNKLQNTFSFSTFKQDTNRLSDNYTIGLSYLFQSIHQEPIDTNINSIFIFGAWQLKPARFFSLDAYGQYGIGSNTNEYIIRGKIELDFGKLGQLSGELMNQRYAPDILQQRLFIAEREVYDSEFIKPFSTSVKANYTLPQTKTSISAQYHLLNNYIYYDTLAIARQATDAINILQLQIRQDFRFGPVGIDNTFAIQRSNSDFIRMPSFFMKHSIYLEGNIFKRVMFARFGFDFRLNTTYFADAYQPVTGQFHLQDSQEVEFYPALDMFLNFKVKTFRAFAKMENMTSWFTDKIYYQTPGHPLAEAHFRFGVSWRFID